MQHSHRLAGVAVAFAAALLAAPAALAIPPTGPDGPDLPPCPPGYERVGVKCVKIPEPPPPTNLPVLTLETPRQSTDQATVRVAGRATDADKPAQALTVRISIDGVLRKTMTANLPDPPIATPGVAKIVPPPTLPGHRFDATIPAAAGANQVCVTAVNVGPAGPNRTVCKNIDRVLEFAANGISYDIPNAQIVAANLETLDSVTNTNNTTVQQSTTVSGEKSVAETYGWKHTQGVKVTASAKVGIPFIGSTQITVEGSLNFEQNGSTTTTRKFAWQQPVLVPAKSKVEAHIAVTKTQLRVPYILPGPLRLHERPPRARHLRRHLRGRQRSRPRHHAHADRPRRHARGAAGRPAARGDAVRGLGGVELFARRLMQVGVIRHPGQRVAEVVDEAARALDHQRLDALERVLEHAQRR